jgi:hypothetical protein
MSKTIKTVSLAVVALVAIYLGYQLLERWMNPCEGVFQQSAVGLNTKLDVIKTKGEFAIGRQNVQELKDRAQEVALNLKACCIVLGKASGEFLRCKEGFDRYETEVKKVATLVTEAEAAKEQGQSEIAVQKIAEANESLKNAETKAQALAQQVAEIKGKDKGREGPSGTGGAQAGGQAAPVTTGYESVHMKAWPEGSRFRVKVNGLPVGTYDSTIELYLDPFLKVGSVNTVTFTFDRLPKNLYGVVLSVRVAGSENWVEVFKYTPSQERLEDSFEVPFVGAKKQ